jgi:hypothetical protein
MDPVVLAFGTAMVGAIANSTWRQISDAVTGLWRRVHPEQADSIGTELDELRKQVLQARLEGDTGAENTLEGVWQVKLQQLLRAQPTLAPELRRVLEQVLIPALSPEGQARIANVIMTGSSHDSSSFTQIGTQINYDQP